MMNQAGRAINQANFVAAAKMIEFNNIEPAFIEGVMKQEVERSRLKYAYPAIIANAQIHRDAYKFGYTPSRRGESPRVCPCCLEQVNKEQIGICYRTSKIQLQEQMGYEEYKLRPGISLFFSFIQMLIVYFVFRFLICDGFNLITNIVVGKYCNDGAQIECEPYVWNLVSIYNKKDNAKFILVQDILSLVLVVLSIAFFFLYRMRQYKKAKILNDRNQSQEDYTILVQNIPLIDFPSKNEAKKMRANQSQGQNMELYHRQHLWKYFESKIKNWIEHKKQWRIGEGSNQGDFAKLISQNNGQLRSQQIVKSISLCYNLQRLQTLQHERDELVKNNQKYEKLRRQIQNEQDDSALGIQQVDSDNRFSSIAKQVQFLNDCQIILNKQYATDNSVLFNITNFVGKALVSFQYQHYREYILEEAERNVNFLVLNGARLKVHRVSNPRDINWKNFRHTHQKQNKKSFTTIYTLIFVVLICFGLLCATEVGKIFATESYLNNENSLFGKIGKYGFIGLSIFIILVSNEIIFAIGKNKVKGECHYSKDSQSLSVIIKSVIAQFVCTAILPYSVSRIFNNEIAAQNGLILQMTSLIIVYGVVINILSLIYPRALVRSVKLCKYRSKQPEESINKFQTELNRDFQYPKFDIVNRYVNYIIIVFTASFYAYLIPATIPILVIIFFIQFWIDKLNLFKRSSHPHNFSFYLTRNILKIFEASVFIFGLGTLVFGFYIHASLFNILNIICFGISTLYLWFLLGASIKLQRRLFGSYQSSQRAIYDDCAAEGKFQQTYWSENPATYLVKQSQITGRHHVLNPVLNRILVTNAQMQSRSPSMGQKF